MKQNSDLNQLKKGTSLVIFALIFLTLTILHSDLPSEHHTIGESIALMRKSLAFSASTVTPCVPHFRGVMRATGCLVLSAVVKS